MWILTTLFTVGTLAAFDKGVCWKNSQGRSTNPLSTCLSHQERNGALCYPKCKSGYYGVGPVCWQNCPSGYFSTGAFCQKGGYATSSTGSCPWYDICGLTFARGCKKCPSGTRFDGCTCWHHMHVFAKKTYGRGWGEAMRCKPHEEQQGALCYSKCPTGYGGNLSTCWQDCKNTPNTKHDGGGICCDSKATCAKKNADLALAGFKAGVSLLGTILTGGALAPDFAGDVLTLADGLIVKMCDTSGKPSPSPPALPPAPSPCSATFFEHGGFQGRSWTMTETNRWINSDTGSWTSKAFFNDAISSIKVSGKGCVVITAEHHNGEGKRHKLPEGNYDYNKLLVGNDHISSAMIAESGSCPIERNTDFAGGDLNAGGTYGRIKGHLANAEECRKACMEFNGCKSWTFVKTEPSGDNCAVKGSKEKTNVRSSTCCDSGQVGSCDGVRRRLQDSAVVDEDSMTAPEAISNPPCLHADFAELEKELDLDSSGPSLAELIASGDVILDNPEDMEDTSRTLADLGECDAEQRAAVREGDPTEEMPAPAKFLEEDAN